MNVEENLQWYLLFAHFFLFIYQTTKVVDYSVLNPRALCFLQLLETYFNSFRFFINIFKTLFFSSTLHSIAGGIYVHILICSKRDKSKYAYLSTYLDTPLCRTPSGQNCMAYHSFLLSIKIYQICLSLMCSFRRASNLPSATFHTLYIFLSCPFAASYIGN